MENNSVLSDNTAFINDRDTIRNFISRIRRVQYLANISGVSKSTVERAFKLQNFEELSGNTLIVWENAMKMYEEFESLKVRAKCVAASIRKTDKVGGM